MNTKDTQYTHGIIAGAFTFWVYAMGFSFFTGEPIQTWLIMTSISLAIVVSTGGLFIASTFGKTPANRVYYTISTIATCLLLVALGEFLVPSQTPWYIVLAISAYGLIVGLAGSTAANCSVKWNKPSRDPAITTGTTTAQEC